MNKALYFIVTIIIICTLSVVTQARMDRHFARIEAQQCELITVYTSIDIIYLEGTTVTTETGRIWLTFNTRIQAINFVEQLTADIANGYDYE